MNREALQRLEQDARAIFDGPECTPTTRDVIEWYAASIRVLLDSDATDTKRTDVVVIRWYTSRKFLIALFTLLSATGLVFTGHIADGVYSAVVIATVGAYIAGNVAQKATTKTTAERQA